MSNKVRIDISNGSDGTVVGDNFFGLHLEHIWNCIYPCVWVGKESSVPNIDGIRKDTVELLKALRPSVFKYPGGYFSDVYDWRDGIGPREQRPKRSYHNTPTRVEANQFGTPEFIQFCRLIGAEPYLAVNTIGLTPHEAAQWVEYCNCDKDTSWTRRRREDGFEEPLNVKYWSIGNEAYWLHSPESYAELYRKFGHYMLSMDPSIALVAAGIEVGHDSLVGPPWNENGDWADVFCRKTRAGRSFFGGDLLNTRQDHNVLYALHLYDGAKDEPITMNTFYKHLKAVLSRVPNSIASLVKIFDETRVDYPRPKLCIDELGLLFEGYPMSGNMTQPAPFWLALWLAAFYQRCMDNAEYIGIMVHPGPINMEHELLVLEDETVVATPSYHAFSMLRDHGNGQRMECKISGISKNDGLGQMPLLVTATKSAQGTGLKITITNLDVENAYDFEISTGDVNVTSVSARELYCDDMNACNSSEQPNMITVQEAGVAIENGSLLVSAKAHSILTINALIIQELAQVHGIKKRQSA